MKVMVLGGGSCQMNLIERLKKQGDEVVLIDYLPDCPASSLSDTHLLISTFDTKSVLEAARKFEIEAIITLGTDQPVLTAAKVAEELDLPFYLTSEQALAATNKRVMKKMFTKNGIPTANYRLIKKDFEDRDIKDISFPVVLKPVDSQGQRGIYKLNSIEEIREHMADTLSFSREDKALLEEYYESDEITVNGWLSDGKLALLSVVDRVSMTAGAHIGICIAHNFPSLHLKEYYDEIQKLTEQIVSVFGFKNGPVYFQYLIGKDRIKVNEIAMRIGGAYEDITLLEITGFDVLKMLIDTVKGKSLSIDKLQRYNLVDSKIFLSTQMFFLKAGKIKKIFYDKGALKKCKVEIISISFKIGETVGDIKNATARAGYFIVQGEDFEDMMHNVDAAYDEISILNENDENMVIRYSEYLKRYKFVLDEKRLS